MPDPRICCIYGVCCEPPEQVAELATHFGISTEAAEKIAGLTKDEGHVLVPRHVDPVGASIGTAQALAAQKELAQLHRMLRARLPRILEDLGYGKVEMRPPEPPA